MKAIKKLCLFLALLCLFLPWGKEALAQPIVKAKAAVLIDGNSGQLLWEQNAFEPLPPASTSKILTAITVLDMADINSTLTVSEKASLVGESSINLQPGESFSIYNLLLGALIHSGNDACYALGEYIGGSESFFVRLLNLKAQALGAYSAKMENTNGLPGENHLINAYDLALLSRYAMANQVFRDIVSLPKAKVIGGDYTRSYNNTNRLLLQNEYIIGVKTGTTNQAGACLVSAMEKDGKILIAVVLNSPNRYEESLEILNYGMENFNSKKIIAKGDICGYYPVKGSKSYLPLIAATDGLFLLPQDNQGLIVRWKLPAYLLSSTSPGQIVGRLEIEDEAGNSWCGVDITVGEKASPKNEQVLFPWFKGESKVEKRI